MIITAATHPGGSRNQDAHAVLVNAAVVLDGASSFTPTVRGQDGGWYAAHLLAELTPRLIDPTVPISQCLRAGITAMRDKHGVTASGPSSTVLVARWTDTELQLLVLGDSTAVVQRDDRTWEAITDARLSRIAPENRRGYRSRLAAGHGMGDEHRARLADLQAAQRQRRNRPRGYWIAESDPNAADHALTRTIPLAGTARVLLATDGAAAAVEDYRHPGDWDDYMTVVRTSPAQALANTHRLEERDPNAQRWPRAKRHDDKTLVLLEL